MGSMATLSKSSTDQDVWDAYDDNASYREDGSASKAAIFVTACEILLRRRPERISTSGYAVDFDSLRIESALDRAIGWESTNASSGESVRHASFSRMRD